MKENPLVSVALCTCNGERHLGAQLATLLAQTHREIEVVAFDDASTDSTVAILRDAAARDSRIRVHCGDPRIGLGANFARAMADCRGAFIAPCDQDDLWDPRKIERLLGALGGASLAYCDSELVDAEARPLGRRLSDERRMYEGADPLALVATNSASGHAMLFRRELLQRAVPFPPGVHYDWWLAIVAAAAGGLRYVDVPLVRFRRHAAAATGIGRSTPRQAWREWVAGRRDLLVHLARLDTPRAAEAAELAGALNEGLAEGRWGKSLRLAWRHRGPLTAVLGLGLIRLGRRLLVQGSR